MSNESMFHFVQNLEFLGRVIPLTCNLWY